MHNQVSINRIGFYQGMAILFVALTFVGFAPTFFLRPLFDNRPLPLTFHIHGLFSTFWVLLFLLQSFLIASNNVSLHRRVGIFGTLIAGGFLLSGLAILYYRIEGYPANGWEIGFLSAIVWGNIAILTCFSIFWGGGLAFRSRPAIHKRLMLFATLSMMGQPLTRLGQFDFFILSDVRPVNDAIFGLGGLFVLFLVVAIYDVRKLGRPHPTFWLAISLQFGLTIISALWIAPTEFGQSVIFMVN